MTRASLLCRCRCGSCPDHVLTWMALDHSLASRGRLAEVITHYAEAVRLNPKYAETHSQLATALLRQDRPGQAVVHDTWALYNVAIAEEPRRHAVLISRAWSERPGHRGIPAREGHRAERENLATGFGGGALGRCRPVAR